MYIVAGLGNPDRKYAGTRHNIGFDVITYLSDKYNISLSKAGFKSKLGQGFIEGEKVLLMKPQTYMNLSGEAVGEAVNFYKLDAASELIIVQDDIDLPPGNIRIRAKGSAGGHNGIKSIISHLGSNEFIRIKVGVGGKPEGGDLACHVLSGFDRDTEPLIRKVIEVAGAAVITIMKDGAEAAMNKYNGMKIEV
ncbi:MAG: aminoacyl-tRNA hydrolase [Catonella sp.]|uniref:aminoacyl-tRNA hydrolase n=1 Tax=Catonella sp. TaxID=2382125 RepID=UPI003FA17E27